MKTYYTKQHPATGMDLKTEIECFPAIVTDDNCYNCEFCGRTDCKHYNEIMQIETQELDLTA